MSSKNLPVILRILRKVATMCTEPVRLNSPAQIGRPRNVSFWVVAVCSERNFIFFATILQMKITIIGSSGSGKSTLAKKISQAFAVPRLELDRLWFAYGGHLVMNGTIDEKQVVSDQIAKTVSDFLSDHDSWVCDGTYAKIQPLIAKQADVLVLIKRPLYRRIISHIKRIITSDGRHPEVTPWQDLLFTKTLIKRWWRGEDKNLNNLVLLYEDKLVVCQSFKEIDRFFQTLQ